MGLSNLGRAPDAAALKSGAHSLAIAVLIGMLLIPGASYADDPPFAQRLSITATALSDQLLEVVTTHDIAIRSAVAVQAIGQLNLSVNEHFADLEILEGATLKADGRRLDVPADKILASNLPNAPQFGIFAADEKIRTMVFPDVAVGDTVHNKMRVREKMRALPGGFAWLRAFALSDRVEAATVTLDIPVGLAVNESFAGLTRTEEPHGQRRVISWTLEPHAYRAAEPNATAALDRDPYLGISSYPDWQAIGQQFLDGAAPMSVPTPELRALAENITKDITDRRDQARAIYDWVSKNVRYMAIFLGKGSYIPHSAVSILDNKYGDCKDHATLMRALLAAKGIEADYVLIPTTAIYRDLSLPAPDWFNHAILWLPEFDHYVDPTASTASFESLPYFESDKSVLRAGSRSIVLTRTPPISADSNRLTVTADVTLSPEGRPKGSATIAAAGPEGVSLREVMMQVALKGGEELAKERLAAQNWRGTGRIEAREANDHSEPFIVKTDFDLSDRFFADEINVHPIPVGPRLVAPYWEQFNAVLKNKRTENFVCGGQTYQQIIDFHLPEGHTLSKVPGSIEVTRPLASFEAHYELKDQTLHVMRRVVTRVPGQSCSAQQAEEMAPVLEAAQKAFRWHPQFAAPEASPRARPVAYGRNRR